MNTTKEKTEKRYRKLIDIDGNTEFILSHQATDRSMSLKSYIEFVLQETAQDSMRTIEVVTKKDKVITEEDLKTALTGEQLKERMHKHIDILFANDSFV